MQLLYEPCMQYINHCIPATLQQRATESHLTDHITNYRHLQRTEKIILFSISEVSCFAQPLYL